MGKVELASLLEAETNIEVYEWNENFDGIAISYSDAKQKIQNGDLVLVEVTSSIPKKDEFGIGQFFYPVSFDDSSLMITFAGSRNDDTYQFISPTANDYLDYYVELAK